MVEICTVCGVDRDEFVCDCEVVLPKTVIVSALGVPTRILGARFARKNELLTSESEEFAKLFRDVETIADQLSALAK